ncbi:COX15/CtaA family protein [Lampropedia aestuarii]|uniref:COX15/CtaA family protein n=1 Tax=Lampropedia aestuarii TaxID=2562762 RepID=UPI00246920F5|nr:COX15/CtaA family protein [Lampropedia aestuarii]MDH5857512.1 COX15/CtaA family protein [Lampropedia aestuarii]
MDSEVALYDWSPVLHLLLVGGLIAVVPLVWVWRRNHKKGMQGVIHALALMTLVLTLDLVMFGAFTRLTDSGLGCPDWPGCYGKASPMGAHQEISAAQQAQPSGPVTHQKAWIEMVHRYLATAVGALIVAIAVLSWWCWRRFHQGVKRLTINQPSTAPPVLAPLSPAWAIFTLFWVCLQGAFGAWTVTMKLFPAIVTMHLLGGMVLLILLCVQVERWRQITAQVAARAVPWGLRCLIGVVFAVLLVQIALGGWVSTNYAVLACTTFPDCNGFWWPEMQLRQGFTLWRELGMQADGNFLEFSALVGIHFVHRLFAIVVFVLGAVLTWRLLQEIGRLRVLGQFLGGLLLLQLLTGLSNVVLDWPLIAAVLHTGGAAALVIVLTQLWSNTRAMPTTEVTPLFTEINRSERIDTNRVAAPRKEKEVL